MTVRLLLLGSLLLFVALAGLMLGTRRIDWYGLGQPATAVDSAGKV
jgi:inner membrane protein involved in colicin E2 resistance